MTVIPFPGGKKNPTGAKPIVSVKSDIEAALPRDQWDRPLIIPPGGGDPVAYRRASTVAEVLPDQTGLSKWRARLQAEGLAKRPDLTQAIHTADRKEMAAILEEAFLYAGGGVAAKNGETLHRLTELLDNGGETPQGLPDNIKAMIDAYQKAMADWEVLDSERFVVQDAIQTAGTYDLRLRHKPSGMVVIGDKKTSQKMDHHVLKTPAQVAVYASGVWYDLDGDRTPHGADRDWGVFVWLPWTDEARTAMCEVVPMDLRLGREIIKEARKVEKFRKWGTHITFPTRAPWM